MRTLGRVCILAAGVVLCGCGRGPSDSIVARLTTPLPEWTKAEEKEFDLAEFVGTVITNQEYLEWLGDSIDTDRRGRQTEYRRYSEALVAKARQPGLDEASLSQVLGSIETNVLASHGVPFAAHLTTFRGRPVWIVSLHRGSCFDVFAYSAEDVVQMAYCGCR